MAGRHRVADRDASPCRAGRPGIRNVRYRNEIRESRASAPILARSNTRLPWPLGGQNRGGLRREMGSCAGGSRPHRRSRDLSGLRVGQVSLFQGAPGRRSRSPACTRPWCRSLRSAAHAYGIPPPAKVACAASMGVAKSLCAPRRPCKGGGAGVGAGRTRRPTGRCSGPREPDPLTLTEGMDGRQRRVARTAGLPPDPGGTRRRIPGRGGCRCHPASEKPGTTRASSRASIFTPTIAGLPLRPPPAPAAMSSILMPSIACMARPRRPVRIAQERRQPPRHDLPAHSEAILQPAALALSPSVLERGPQPADPPPGPRTVRGLTEGCG